MAKRKRKKRNSHWILLSIILIYFFCLCMDSLLGSQADIFEGLLESLQISGQLLDLRVEVPLELFHDPEGGLIVDQVNGRARATESTGATDAVKVHLIIRLVVLVVNGEIKVDHQGHLGNIHTTGNGVGGHNHLGLGVPEILHHLKE